MNFKKFFQLVAYYITPIGVLVALYFSPDRHETALSLGGFAWQLLLIILFVRPLGQILPRFTFLKKLTGMRKELGVMMFWVFLGHGLYLFQEAGLLHMQNFFYLFTQPTNTLFWGFLSGIIIFLLGITSNTTSMKYLKKNWKKLHKLVYPGLVFTALHIYFIAGDIGPIIVVIIYGTVSYMARKKIVLLPKKTNIS